MMHFFFGVFGMVAWATIMVKGMKYRRVGSSFRRGQR